MKGVVNELAKCEDFGSKFAVGEEFWEEVSEIVSVLRAAYNFTVEMQRTGYGLADFYIGWIRVTINLKRIQNSAPRFDLASTLLESMERRATALFKSPLLLCAVYLDPRIMYKLSDEQKATAATDLLKIHARIKDAAGLNVDQDCSANNTLDEIQADYRKKQNENQGSNAEILQIFSLYENEKPYDIRAPVMEFWEENGDKFKMIRPLADVLHAVPSNQCYTERSFSSFSYIRSKHRMSMSSENLSNVLMIRLNKDIFYAQRKERIQTILNSKC